MKKRVVTAIILLFLLTTINFQQKISFSKFNLSEIKILNNSILKEKDIKSLLIPIYNKNLITLNYSEINKILMQNSFIESYNLKKKYPNTLIIKIFEKKPIAILVDKTNRFYLSEKIDLIEFNNLKDYQNLPFVFGDKQKFKIFYSDLKKMKFPLTSIKKYTLYEANRWDIETINKKILKLPPKNYILSLENYLSLKNTANFQKYKVFDYRIKDQLILK